MYAATTLEAFIRALSWTLLHSLWVGLIAAFLAGMTIMATRKSRASRRYNILACILFLFVGFTAWMSVNEFTSVLNSGGAGPIASQTQSDAIQTSGHTNKPFSFFSNAINFFNDNARFLLMIWFFIFVIKLIRLAVAIVRLERLRYEKLLAVPESWMQRLEILKAQLNIRKPVQLFESCLVKIPVTLGYLRPVILFPVGSLTGLPVAQLDAVLLHELAHIRRNDYLINIVQLVLEAVFFFNPCVLWISSLIRKERENCCDDMAISKIDSRKDFLTALLSFQDMAFGELRVAQSFSASKTLLVDRARRIVNDQNSTLNKIERKSLFFSIAFLIILLFISKINYDNRGLSAVISRLQINITNLNNPTKNKTATPAVRKENKEDAKPVSQKQNTLTVNDTGQPANTKDTGIVIDIIPVTNTQKRVVKNGIVIESDTCSEPKSKVYLSRSNRTIASIIGDLKDEGLIKDEGEKYTFLLSNERLLVNGIAQPGNIHQKILSKYVPNTALEHINLYYACCR